jgi:hypothetical protein
LPVLRLNVHGGINRFLPCLDLCNLWLESWYPEDRTRPKDEIGCAGAE